METQNALHIAKYFAVVLLRHQTQSQHRPQEDLHVDNHKQMSANMYMYMYVLHVVPHIDHHLEIIHQLGLSSVH